MMIMYFIGDNDAVHHNVAKQIKIHKRTKFGHLNVNGLSSKIDQIKILLQEFQIHVLAISETEFDFDTLYMLKHEYSKLSGFQNG